MYVMLSLYNYFCLTKNSLSLVFVSTLFEPYLFQLLEMPIQDILPPLSNLFVRVCEKSDLCIYKKVCTRKYDFSFPTLLFLLRYNNIQAVSVNIDIPFIMVF